MPSLPIAIRSLVLVTVVLTAAAVVVGLAMRGIERSRARDARRTRAGFGLSGLDAAENMLMAAREVIDGVRVRGGARTSRYLVDERVLELEAPVARSDDCVSVAVACHEAGHALWGDEHPLLAAASSFIRPAKYVSGMVWAVAACACLVSGQPILAAVALAAWLIVLVLQVLSFLAEASASRRALAYLPELGMPGDERGIASRYLAFAALGHLFL